MDIQIDLGMGIEMLRGLPAQVAFDLFYDEDANIGQKIKLSVSIELALQRMKCPHPLQVREEEDGRRQHHVLDVMPAQIPYYLGTWCCYRRIRFKV